MVFDNSSNYFNFENFESLFVANKSKFKLSHHFKVKTMNGDLVFYGAGKSLLFVTI